MDPGLHCSCIPISRDRDCSRCCKSAKEYFCDWRDEPSWRSAATKEWLPDKTSSISGRKELVRRNAISDRWVRAQGYTSKIESRRRMMAK